MSIRLIDTEEDLRAAFPVMHELRPALTETTFVSQCLRQLACGWRLAIREVEGRVVACAGFRVSESLAWGKALYVDDLVTTDERRSQGHGDALFSWLLALAQAEGCGQFHLDSGVQRHGAHRFYLQHRMDITSHHFALRVPSA